MNNRHGLRAECSISMNVGHHVMTQLPLFFRGHFVVDAVDMGFQLIHLLLRDRQAQLHLCPG